MGKSGEFRRNSKTFQEILTSSAIQTRLHERAESAAARANASEGTPRTERGELYGFVARSTANPHTRAGSRVIAVGPTARRRNAENNTLNKSIGG